MTESDREFFKWEKETFGKGPFPEWEEIKNLYAEHLLATKTKTQIWKMLCGPADRPCSCKCLCMAGIAWNRILSAEANM